ncbi:MAG: uncharacterized protein A8A55_3242 [Amphiamblys sp. WSBS2006]|nr:MAG: uncharacterized protein A8A55_3242 [Amphiamblys sp. WSBS2006]
METRVKTILRHKKIFFLFTEKSIFLFPETEYKQLRQREDGYPCLKRKYLSEVTARDTERVICIACHGEAAPEDLVSPLCRQMHFFLCRKCIDYLQKRKNKRNIFCPYCKGEQGGKAFQEEILGAVLSLMSPQTLPGLEITPDMEVETVTKLTRETKVVLDNIAVTDVLFLELMSKAAVEIRNTVSLVGDDNTFDWRTKERIQFCFDGYTDEEMKQIHENIKAMPSKNIQINAKEIYAEGDSVYFLLKAWAGAGRYSPDLFLKTSKKEHIEEFLEEEDSSLWIGKVKTLDLRGYAVEILPVSFRRGSEASLQDISNSRKNKHPRLISGGIYSHESPPPSTAGFWYVESAS